MKYHNEVKTMGLSFIENVIIFNILFVFNTIRYVSKVWFGSSIWKTPFSTTNMVITAPFSTANMVITIYQLLVFILYKSSLL